MKKLAFGVLLSASVCFCQAPGKERDTLPALLDEVHQLRQAIEGMTVASQRVQIALYGLQLQDAAIARSTQRLDTVRNRCLALEANRKRSADRIERMEGSLAAGTLPESQAKDYKAELPGFKRELEAQTAEAQACQAAESEATSQLRSDQAKLLELQDRITRLDKALEQLSGAGK